MAPSKKSDSKENQRSVQSPAVIHKKVVLVTAANANKLSKLRKSVKATGKETITIPEKKKISKKKKGSDNNNADDNFNKEYENIYNKIYQEVYQEISKTVDGQLNEIKSAMFTREEVIERINISGDRNKNLFTQQLTVLPQLVESVVEEYDRERLSKEVGAAKAKKDGLKIKHCKSDFLKSLLHVSENINFGDVLNKSTKIKDLRLLYKDMNQSEIISYDLGDASDLAKIISLRCFKDCFTQARKSRNFDEETVLSSLVTLPDGSSKKIKGNTIQFKGVTSHRNLGEVIDYRIILQSTDENKSSFEDRIIETDLFRKELLTILSSLTTNKEILKYLHQGEMTRFGIQLNDAVAPQAYDFIINSLSKYIFDVIGLPSFITFSISNRLVENEDPEVTKLLLPSQADYFDIIDQKIQIHLKYKRRVTNKRKKEEENVGNNDPTASCDDDDVTDVDIKRISNDQNSTSSITEESEEDNIKTAAADILRQENLRSLIF